MKYSREDGCLAWATYSLLPSVRLQALLDQFDSAEAMYDEFMRTNGDVLKSLVNDACIRRLRKQAASEEMHSMMLSMQRNSMGVLTLRSDKYPDELRNLNDPPAVLFYQGNPECLIGRCVTIVGTRRPSAQCLAAASKIAQDFAEAGVTVVSGLAYGIDTAAHEGCLNGGHTTAGIMACGLDVDYPERNAELKKEIVRTGGVLLGEYPPGTEASRFAFQSRNRIMAGLSRATLLIEAEVRSGSMLTVHHALDQGREVYAYPGNIGTPMAEGAHTLLREGATYFTSAADVLQDMGWGESVARSQKSTSHSKEQELPSMSEEEHAILRYITQNGEVSYDQISDAVGLDPSKVSVALTMLTIKGLIKTLPGKTYIKN